MKTKTKSKEKKSKNSARPQCDLVLMKPKRREGRPSKISEAMIKKICKYIRMGSWVEVAAAACGIESDTVRNWLRKGNAYLKYPTDDLNGEGPLYAEFVKQVDKAMAYAELLDLRRIDKAAEKFWTAAAWKLERRYPDRFALVNRHELNAKVNLKTQIKVKVDDLKLPLDVRMMMLERMRELKSRNEQTPLLEYNGGDRNDKPPGDIPG